MPIPNDDAFKRISRVVKLVESKPDVFGNIGGPENITPGRHVVLKVVEPTEDQGERYTCQVYVDNPCDERTGDLQESDLGSLDDTEYDCWNIGNIGGDDHIVEAGTITDGWIFHFGHNEPEPTNPVIIIDIRVDNDHQYDADELWIHKDTGPEAFGDSAIFQHIGPVGDGDDIEENGGNHDERKEWQPVELTDNGDGSYTITLHGPKALGEGAIEEQPKAVFDSRGHLSESDTLDGTASITIPANPTLSYTTETKTVVTNVYCLDGEIHVNTEDITYVKTVSLG